MSEGSISLVRGRVKQVCKFGFGEVASDPVGHSFTRFVARRIMSGLKMGVGSFKGRD